MTQTAADSWQLWRACPPDPQGAPVEVLNEGWTCSRLWRPSGPPPKDAPDLHWRPCCGELRTLAFAGGIYDAEGLPLYGSPSLINGTSDANGPWNQMFVVGPADRGSGPVTRLWLVAPMLDLVDVPPVILGDLVAAADRGETIVMRGPVGDRLRTFAEQIVGMTGGGSA